MKDWSGSSRPTDTLFRLRQAYFVWSDTLGEGGMPYSFSLGRRQSTEGFLANMRENYDEPNSSLAHITNMEVNGAMLQLNTDKYLTTGSYIKGIFGKAHAGGITTATDSTGGYRPYAQTDGDAGDDVNYLVFMGSFYNDGQYNLMFQNSNIFNTKGAKAGIPVSTANSALGAGTAHFNALSLQVDGVGNGISDFLDKTKVFGSIAMTQSKPDKGYQLLGSTEEKSGSSFWTGINIPDMITDNGRFGFEYNHGSRYWTPTTWAEDTLIGSKIAVRGDAYEAYWNFDLFGSKNLQSQLRYTYLKHDYTPNIRCAGWVTPTKVDIEATDIRAMIRYTY